MRGISCAVYAGATLGITAWLAATALLAQGGSQLSAAYTEKPASLHAPVARIGDLSKNEPRRAGKQLQFAANDRTDRFELWSRTPASHDGLSQRFTPRFADIDPGRLSVPAQVGQPPSFLAYAWIPGAAVSAGNARPQDAVSVSDSAWNKRTGSLPPDRSLAPYVTAEMIALALAETEEQAPGPVMAGALDSSTAAGAEDASAPVVLAMTIPIPEPRPAYSPEKKQAPPAALAYANPDVVAEEDKSGGIFGRLLGGRAAKRLPGPAAKVAVYDISSATVYMPNGEKLEAHSGLAHMQDDPGYIAEKNRGPTPPNLYNLRMRESRFHGVEAIRLLPADGRKKYNRDGLLAHTYMYVGGGSRSQSNGCVVFKDYHRFLTAFKKGEIERLIVVPSMEKLPTYLAAL